MSDVVLVTGGFGYIGSHVVVEILNYGDQVVVIDNLSNSSELVKDRLEEITGKKITFIKGDILDKQTLRDVFENYKIDSVIHLAGLKAVGESMEAPLDYYKNNVLGSLNLLQTMDNYGIKTIVFSSSATVYGQPEILPLIEKTSRLAPTNPYGHTKMMVERVLHDLYLSDSSWRISILRYFNPVGAHESGIIGENPNGIPNNLMPYISQTAVGKRDIVYVFGNDYSTRDGTGIRDYIHVVDLAKGHLCALENCKMQENIEIFNLGTGRGHSVLELINMYAEVSGKEIPYKIVERRPGDIAECYADVSKAKEILNWQAKFTLKNMCADSWRWQKTNPNGYE